MAAKVQDGLFCYIIYAYRYHITICTICVILWSNYCTF